MSIRYIPIVEARRFQVFLHTHTGIYPNLVCKANKVGLVTLHQMLHLITDSNIKKDLMSEYFPLLMDKAGTIWRCESVRRDLVHAFAFANEYVQIMNKEQPNYAKVVYRPAS